MKKKKTNKQTAEMLYPMEQIDRLISPKIYDFKGKFQMYWFRRYVKGAEWLLTYMLIFLTQTEQGQPIGTTAFIFKPTKLWLRTIKKIDTRGC